MTATRPVKYRPEIDGLRALAVVPVLLFHGQISGFSGGFIGVDVFFVISGYLITGLLVPEIDGDRFSLTRFYERRARRILPALFVVMAFSAACAYAIFLDSDLNEFARSVVATSLFSSNFLFWTQVDYFAAPDQVKPLLHTWSLAVEEQFYIVFPLVLLAIHRYFPHRLKRILVSALVASLLVSALLVAKRPVDAFYLPHSRAWELLAGALRAIRAIPKPGSRLVNEILSAIGVASILVGVHFIDESMPFPGFTALVPCVGTALVIWANEGHLTATGRLLSSKPLVAVGLISYSLYLWHWPMLVFAEYYVARPLTTNETLTILVLTFALAAASWRFVESPFRGRSSVFSRKQIFAGSTLAGVILIAGGFTVNAADRLPYRPELGELDAGNHPDHNRCFPENPIPLVAGDRLCSLGVPDGSAPDFIVWGDSHADAVFPALSAAATATGTHGLFAALAACPPLLGVTRPGLEGPRYPCIEFNDAVLNYIVEKDIDNVFLIARWSVSVLGRTPYETSIGERPVFITDDASETISAEENRHAFERGLHRTLDALTQAGARVWLLQQVPSADMRVPQYLATHARSSSIDEVRLTLGVGMTGHRRIRDILDRFLAEYAVEVIDPTEALCLGDECLVASNGHNVYRDDDHLSTRGSLLLQPLFEAAFRRMEQ